MHLNLIIRDGQRQIAHVEVQTFRSDLYVAQLVVNKPGTDERIDAGTDKRIAVPLDACKVKWSICVAELPSAKNSRRSLGG